MKDFMRDFILLITVLYFGIALIDKMSGIPAVGMLVLLLFGMLIGRYWDDLINLLFS